MRPGGDPAGRWYDRPMAVEGWLRAELQGAEADRRPDAVARYIEEQVVELLGPDAPDGPMPRSFFQIGLESLQAVELLTRLQFALGADVPPEALDWPTIDGLAGFLASSADISPA